MLVTEKEGLGSKWVEIMSYSVPGASAHYNCAAVVTYGESYSKRRNYYYHAGWKDIKRNTGPRIGTTYWIQSSSDGCCD